MKDRAREISATTWQWYKKYRDQERTEAVWQEALQEVQELQERYRGTADYSFAVDMFLIFVDRLEQMDADKR